MVESSRQVGDYLLDQFLGEGSFGKVYRATNIKTNEVVAVKCMDMNKLKDPFMIKSLKTEIHVMKDLKSQNVVKMYDVIYQPETTYIVLEFCPDGDLEKFIQKHGGMLEEQQAINVLKQLMNGFGELISHKYIHRDIKPANALVKDGIHKVADFGFACEADIPWPCRDLNSFLYNIKKTPLRFPYNKPISTVTKDFIKQSLQVNEEKRIGWDQIFTHPIFQSQSSQNPQIDHSHIQLDQKATKILQKIQQVVQNHRLDITKIFENFDKDKGGTLDSEEFYKMMAVVDPRITFREALHIFQQVDTSHDGKLSMGEFKAIFEEFDFHDLNDRAGRILNDIKEIVRENHIDLKKIFNTFDADKGGDLDLKEFSRLIKNIAPGLKDYEILQLFKKFDINNDNNVSFDEFCRLMCYGIKGQEQNYNPKKEKVKRIVSELKRIIVKYNLNILDIFKNFDKSGDGNLDLLEFTKLCQVIDKNLHGSDVKAVFEVFSPQGQEISFMQFYEHLK